MVVSFPLNIRFLAYKILFTVALSGEIQICLNPILATVTRININPVNMRFPQ